MSRLTFPSDERSFEHKIPAAEKALSAFDETCWFGHQKIIGLLQTVTRNSACSKHSHLSLIAANSCLSVVLYDRLIPCEGGQCTALLSRPSPAVVELAVQYPQLGCSSGIHSGCHFQPGLRHVRGKALACRSLGLRETWTVDTCEAVPWPMRPVGWVHALNYDTACGSCGLTAPLHVSTAESSTAATAYFKLCVRRLSVNESRIYGLYRY